jgi:cellulose synthase (UDP-forming)
MIDNKVEVCITRICLVITLGILAEVLHFLVVQGTHALFAHQGALFLEIILFGAAVLFLIYGNLLYQLCRLGYFRRRQNHKRVPQETFEQMYEGKAPSLAILIPTYKEEPSVIWQTMLSAALMEYPEKSIVLLIDDPYRPKSTEDSLKLEQTRGMPAALQTQFDTHAERYRAELVAFRRRVSVDVTAEIERLAKCYAEVATRLETLAAQFENEIDGTVSSHTDRFFVREIIQKPAMQHAAFAEELRERLYRRDIPDTAFIERHYVRLAGFFNVRFSSFERKKYRNLSHEANKAMNLNSYIGLMGKAWKEIDSGNGWELLETAANRADFEIAEATYLITLDADSVLLPDYALRLIHVMEQPENQAFAVIQTPYSAFPDSPKVLERVAGATTDLQYITHQGFTSWDGTFWVGANALIRRRALEDIKHMRLEHGSRVSVYIQDRTVIEDTESTIDLISKGWKLHNYPERLAYSATPPDFGSLLIQRRRWANGGLLIVPKLLRYGKKRPARLALFIEIFLRLHYLVSPAGVSAATLLIFFYPFTDSFVTLWIPLSALPYFILYARDLKIAGYRYSDLFRVYALNLALIPVMLGGVWKSLQQAITKTRTPFGRTPKVSHCTAIPALYCFLELMLPAIFLATFGCDIEAHRWFHALFSVVNGAFFVYALAHIIGVKDISSGLVPSQEAVEAWVQGQRAPRTLGTLDLDKEPLLKPPVFSQNAKI